jgi:hypothetical protein
MPAPAPKKPSKPPVLEAPSTEPAKPGTAKVPDVKKPPVVVETPPQELPPPPQPPKPEPKKPVKSVRKTAPKPAPTAPPAVTPAQGPPAAPAEVTPPTPAPETPPAVDAPKLGEVLTPEQRTQVQTDFELSRTEARKALTQVDAHKLNREQSETAARARNFLAQAERLQESDLRTAAQLARRAQLLAQDILKEFN